MTPPSANLKVMFHLAYVGAASLPAIRMAIGAAAGEVNMSRLVASGMVRAVNHDVGRGLTYSLTPQGHALVAEWRLVLGQFPALQERKAVA